MSQVDSGECRKHLQTIKIKTMSAAILLPVALGKRQTNQARWNIMLSVFHQSFDVSHFCALAKKTSVDMLSCLYLFLPLCIHVEHDDDDDNG